MPGPPGCPDCVSRSQPENPALSEPELWTERCAAENNNQGSALFLIICTSLLQPPGLDISEIYPQSQFAVRWSLSSCAGRSWQIEQIVKTDTNNDINTK